MFAPKTPRTINKTSQPLLVPFFLAILTIQMVIIDTIATTIKYAKWAKLNGESGTIPVPPKIEKTMATIEQIRTTHVKKLAILYMTYDALCISIISFRLTKTYYHISGLKRIINIIML